MPNTNGLCTAQIPTGNHKTNPITLKQKTKRKKEANSKTVLAMALQERRKGDRFLLCHLPNPHSLIPSCQPMALPFSMHSTTFCSCSERNFPPQTVHTDSSWEVVVSSSWGDQCWRAELKCISHHNCTEPDPRAVNQAQVNRSFAQLSNRVWLILAQNYTTTAEALQYPTLRPTPSFPLLVNSLPLSSSPLDMNKRI